LEGILSRTVSQVKQLAGEIVPRAALKTGMNSRVEEPSGTAYNRSGG